VVQLGPSIPELLGSSVRSIDYRHQCVWGWRIFTLGLVGRARTGCGKLDYCAAFAEGEGGIQTLSGAGAARVSPVERRGDRTILHEPRGMGAGRSAARRRMSVYPASITGHGGFLVNGLVDPAIKGPSTQARGVGGGIGLAAQARMITSLFGACLTRGLDRGGGGSCG